MTDLLVPQLNNMIEVALSPLSINRARGLQAKDFHQIQSIWSINSTAFQPNLNWSLAKTLLTLELQSQCLLLKQTLLQSKTFTSLPPHGMIWLMCHYNPLRSYVLYCSNLIPVISVDFSSLILTFMAWILLYFLLLSLHFWSIYISIHVVRPTCLDFTFVNILSS